MLGFNLPFFFHHVATFQSLQSGKGVLRRQRPGERVWLDGYRYLVVLRLQPRAYCPIRTENKWSHTSAQHGMAWYDVFILSETHLYHLPNKFNLLQMEYYFTTTLHTSFDEAIAKITEALAKEGFGVLTEIDVKATLKKKLDVDFRNYRILGACNPTFAHRALQAEDKIGTMLPCSVVVQEHAANEIEISAIDPMASMMAVTNDNLLPVAVEVREKLKRVIASL